MPIYMTQRMQFNGSRIKLNKFRLILILHEPIEKKMLVPEKERKKKKLHGRIEEKWMDMKLFQYIELHPSAEKKISNDKILNLPMFHLFMGEVVHQNTEMAHTHVFIDCYHQPKHYHRHHHQQLKYQHQ